MSTYAPVNENTTDEEIYDEAECMVREHLDIEPTERDRQIIRLAAETGIRQATRIARMRACAAI